MMMDLLENRFRGRRSVRLKGYDYRNPGACFITVCTWQREALRNGGIVLNETGRIVEQLWREIPGHFPLVTMDAFVIMPNHIHGILWIPGERGGMDKRGGTGERRSTACRAPTPAHAVSRWSHDQ